MLRLLRYLAVFLLLLPALSWADLALAVQAPGAHAALQLLRADAKVDAHLGVAMAAVLLEGCCETSDLVIDGTCDHAKAAPASCNECVACLACHAPGVPSHETPLALGPQLAPTDLEAGYGFASAPVVLAFRPPIASPAG